MELQVGSPPAKPASHIGVLVLFPAAPLPTELLARQLEKVAVQMLETYP